MSAQLMSGWDGPVLPLTDRDLFRVCEIWIGTQDTKDQGRYRRKLARLRRMVKNGERLRDILIKPST